MYIDVEVNPQLSVEQAHKIIQQARQKIIDILHDSLLRPYPCPKRLFLQFNFLVEASLFKIFWLFMQKK